MRKLSSEIEPVLAMLKEPAIFSIPLNDFVFAKFPHQSKAV
jgi:hypothetical protein